MEVAVKEGKYIYCIIATNFFKNFGPLGIGEKGDELYTISYKDISAVVSNSPIVSYSISRENTLTYERAIEEVMKEHTILPVRFNTISRNEKEVVKILEKEYDKFKELLSNIEGKRELGLKAIFKETIYNDIMEKYEEIKGLKEIFGALPPDKTYYQRVEIGKMVEDALEKERELYKEEILTALSPLAQDIKLNNTYGERMIVNAAFLIENDREVEFDQKIQELNTRYSDRIKFKYVGTLPPFNFVNLVINTDEHRLKDTR